MTETSGVDPELTPTDPENPAVPGDTTPEIGGPVIAPPGITQGSYSVCGRCFSVVANLELHHDATHTDTTATEEAP